MEARMARTVETSPRPRGFPFVRTVALSLWRLRQTWRMLLVSGLGVLAAVMLVCAVPLFSQVAMSAGLRDRIAQIQQSPALTLTGVTWNPPPDLLSSARPQIDRVVRGELGAYLSADAPSAFLQFYAGGTQAGGAAFGGQGLTIYGVDVNSDTAAYTLTAGRLPSKLSDTLELAVPQALASAYSLHVGDTQALSIQGPQGPQAVHVTLVGILAHPLAFNSAENYTYGPFPEGQVSSSPSQPDGVLASADTVAGVYATLGGQSNNMPPLVYSWTYHLDLSRLSVDSLSDFSDRLDALNSRDQEALNNGLGLGLYENDSVRGILQEYVGRVIVAQIPIGLLLIQVLGLVLLFIGLMVSILVDRQAEAIAVLRSRGAPRGLVMRTLTLQSLGVGLLALVAGPLLALVLVQGIARLALPAGDQGALNVLTHNPLAAAWSVRWFAFGAGVCAIIAMIVSTRRAANSNVLALRRESARTRAKPLWQRLNLDLVFSAFAILGYTAYSYIVSHVPGSVRPFLSVLALFAMFFLMIAVVMLFLRFFPLLLRLFARIAARGNKAAPMLAIGQMARSPRQASRMTLLLALSTAFTLFALIFAASQAQRASDVATYQAGADFRGNVSPAGSGLDVMSQLTQSYRAIAGVTSATPVYDAQAYGPEEQVELLAVDANTFAQTANWTSLDSTQPLANLMATLAAQRPTATDAVPAVVDDALWQALHLTQGSTFTIALNQGGSAGPIRLKALAHIAHVPPVNDGSDALQGYGSTAVLVDFASYLSVTGSQAAPNGIWLRTKDDAASLASVRAALKSGLLQVSNLQDRRQSVADVTHDPLRIDLLSVLAIAAGTALTLALIGILLGSWLSARTRLTSFALLRALGSEPGQLAGVLLWEQGIVYALALGLGVVLGFVLSAAVLPVVVFTNGSLQDIASSIDVPPVQTVVPWLAVGATLGGLVVLCGGAILLMTRIVARPSISQTLRLNED
jgi:putative ABC transport system permease protein